MQTYRHGWIKIHPYDHACKFRLDIIICEPFKSSLQFRGAILNR